MSTLRANTLKPITSGNSLVLQGDSGGSGVSGPSIDSNGDVDFSQNTNAKVKLPSGGGIYESDGSTEILTESSGIVSLKNTIIDSTSTNNITVIGFSGRLENDLTGNGDRWTWSTSVNYFANGVTVATSGSDDGKITIVTAGKYMMVLSVSGTKVAGDVNHFLTGQINKNSSAIAATVAMGYNSTGGGDQRIGGHANIIADLAVGAVIDITMGESGDCKTYADNASRFSMYRIGG